VILPMISAIENDGDKTFMLKLYENYYALIRQTVYGITHDWKDIDDLLNDTFVRLIKKTSLLRTLDCCRTASYVVYTSRSVAINFIKHRDVQNKHTYFGAESDLSEELADPDEAFETRIARQNEIESLCGVIAKLPERQKDLLYFKYILEMPDGEIAENFGISPDSVRQYLTRARRAAKKLAEKEWKNHAGLQR